MIALIQLVVSLGALSLVALFLLGLRKKSERQFTLRSLALGALMLGSTSLALAYNGFSQEGAFSVFALALAVMTLLSIIALHRFHKGSFNSKNRLLQRLAYGSFFLLLIHILLQAATLAGD